MTSIGFIGAGTVGTALAVRLKLRGYAIVAVASRTPASAHRLADQVPGCRVYASGDGVAQAADLIFITTPDAAIGAVASGVPWRRGQAVVHCSGVDSLDVLEPARKRGAMVGGFHPLQTFASVAQAVENIPGSTIAVEAEEPLLTTLKGVAESLEGKWVVLKAGDKVLYHAAAVISCNYLVTLMQMATDLWQTFGVDRAEATQALMPLLRGTLNNLEKVGLPNCLTGPVARGDLGTIRKHLEALERAAPHLLPAYRE